MRQAAGELAHLLLQVRVDLGLGVVAGGDDQVLQDLDLVRVGERGVDLDLAHLALAVERDVDHPAAGACRSSRSRPAAAASRAIRVCSFCASLSMLPRFFMAGRSFRLSAGAVCAARADVDERGTGERRQHLLQRRVAARPRPGAARLRAAACSASVGSPGGAADRDQPAPAGRPATPPRPAGPMTSGGHAGGEAAARAGRARSGSGGRSGGARPPSGASPPSRRQATSSAKLCGSGGRAADAAATGARCDAGATTRAAAPADAGAGRSTAQAVPGAVDARGGRAGLPQQAGELGRRRAGR